MKTRLPGKHRPTPKKKRAEHADLHARISQLQTNLRSEQEKTREIAAMLSPFEPIITEHPDLANPYCTIFIASTPDKRWSRSMPVTEHALHSTSKSAVYHTLRQEYFTQLIRKAVDMFASAGETQQ